MGKIYKMPDAVQQPKAAIALKDFMPERKNKAVAADVTVGDALAALRQFVDNLNKQPSLAFRNGIYKGLDKAVVQSVKVDGWTFGYQLKDLGAGTMQRRIYIKSPGQKIAEIPDEQIDPVLISVFETCLDINEGMPEMEEIDEECLLIAQDFMPFFMVENNPRLLVPQ